MSADRYEPGDEGDQRREQLKLRIGLLRSILLTLPHRASVYLFLLRDEERELQGLEGRAE